MSAIDNICGICRTQVNGRDSNYWDNSFGYDVHKRCFVLVEQGDLILWQAIQEVITLPQGIHQAISLQKKSIKQIQETVEKELGSLASLKSYEDLSPQGKKVKDLFAKASEELLKEYRPVSTIPRILAPPQQAAMAAASSSNPSIHSQQNVITFIPQNRRRIRVTLNPHAQVFRPVTQHPVTPFPSAVALDNSPRITTFQIVLDEVQHCGFCEQDCPLGEGSVFWSGDKKFSLMHVNCYADIKAVDQKMMGVANLALNSVDRKYVHLIHRIAILFIRNVMKETTFNQKHILAVKPNSCTFEEYMRSRETQVSFKEYANRKGLNSLVNLFKSPTTIFLINESLKLILEAFKSNEEHVFDDYINEGEEGMKILLNVILKKEDN